MKHSLVRTVGTLALVLSVAGVAQAQWRHCASGGLEGSWAYTETGTIVSPQTGATLATMAVGRYTFDRDGTVTAIQWGSTQGIPIPAPIPPAVADPPDTKKGTYTVDEDTCTITMLLDGYAGDKLIRKSVWQVFFADNGKEMRGVSRALSYHPNGYPNAPQFDLKPVMTMIGTRVTPSAEQGEEHESTSTGTVTDGSCKTPDPFIAIGGGACVAGGWRPRTR